MKRVLMTLIVSLAFSGSILSQTTPTPHWPESGFDWHAFSSNKEIVARIQIDGVEITTNDDFWNIEVCPFVGEEQRGYEGFMVYYDGDPYAVADLAAFYTKSNEALSFKMYNHATNTLYEICQTSEPLYTGIDYDDWEDPVILNFTLTQTFTKDITGYGSNSGGYYLIASPIVEEVTPSSDNGFLTSTYDLYYFDQNETDEWRNYKVGVGFGLTNGKGYLYASSTNTTLTFTGTPNSDNGEVTLAKTANAEFEGLNLVGNPFGVPAYITRPFYRMNVAGTEVLPDECTGAIGVMEGVFVEATEEGETLTFNTEAPAKSANLALNLSQGRGVVDRTVIRFSEGRMLPKFQLNPSNTKVYIPQGGKDYAVVRAGEMGEMPVNFKAEKNGSYTLNFTSEEVSFGYLHLVDNLTGSDVDLLQTPSYTFNALTTDYASRFKLVFATGNSSDDDNFAFMSNGNIIVNNEGEATLQVIDVNGRIIRSESINGAASVSMNAAAGVYMLRLVNGENVKVQKMIVK